MAPGFTGDISFLPTSGGGGSFSGGTLTSALLFSPDNTVDIGASAATRPRTIYVATDVWVGGTIRFGTGAATNGLIGNSASKILFQASGTAFGHNFVSSTAASSGAHANFTITPAANTGQTASTQINGFSWAAFTRQWATGAITTQREFLVNAPTYAFVGASTITTAATVAISGAPIAGTNATITKGHPLWTQGGIPRLDSTTANGTVATVLGSLGPAGASTTVTEWFTIDINGTTRYIPCF